MKPSQPLENTRVEKSRPHTSKSCLGKLHEHCTENNLKSLWRHHRIAVTTPSFIVEPQEALGASGVLQIAENFQKISWSRRNSFILTESGVNSVLGDLRGCWWLRRCGCLKCCSSCIKLEHQNTDSWFRWEVSSISSQKQHILFTRIKLNSVCVNKYILTSTDILGPKSKSSFIHSLTRSQKSKKA